jgi:hypothetical protein
VGSQCWVDGPLTASDAGVDPATSNGDVLMQAITIGLDIAESVFQVHAEDTSGCKIVIQKRLRRGQVAGFFAKLAARR